MGFGCIEETFVRGGLFRSWNGLHLEVVRFPSPRMFKKEVMKLDKMALTNTPTLCFYDSVRNLGCLDPSSCAGAGTLNKCLWTKGWPKFHSPFRRSLKIRMKLQLEE